jgi:hypothetical protein
MESGVIGLGCSATQCGECDRDLTFGVAAADTFGERGAPLYVHSPLARSLARPQLKHQTKRQRAPSKAFVKSGHATIAHNTYELDKFEYICKKKKKKKRGTKDSLDSVGHLHGCMMDRHPFTWHEVKRHLNCMPNDEKRRCRVIMFDGCSCGNLSSHLSAVLGSRRSRTVRDFLLHNSRACREALHIDRVRMGPSRRECRRV